MTTTRERLLEAALDLLDAGGPSAVTLREVGQRAGVSHNTPYRHFADKRDLLACLAARELRELVARFDAVDATGADRLRGAGAAYLEWARTHPARFHLTFGPWSGPHDELHQAAEAASEALRQITRAAQAEGAATDRDPDETASLLWSVVHGAAHLELSGHLNKNPDSATSERLLSEFVSLLG